MSWAGTQTAQIAGISSQMLALHVKANVNITDAARQIRCIRGECRAIVQGCAPVCGHRVAHAAIDLEHLFDGVEHREEEERVVQTILHKDLGTKGKVSCCSR